MDFAQNKYLSVIILILSLAGCDQADVQAKNESGNDNKVRAERPAHAVEVIAVKRQSVSLSRTLTGTLEAPRTVHIHSEHSGRIVELPYHEGDKVKQGAIIAQLDDALLRAGLAKAVASRKQTEVDLQRLQRLEFSNLASQDQLARASTAVELAEAEELLQRTLLERTQIRAPFSGLVSARLVEPGDIVAQNDHMLTIFDPKLMTAAVKVPEQLHSRIKVGDPVQVRIDSLGDSRFKATILRIHPKVDAQTRQGTVETRLDPVPENARPGQLCRVTLKTAKTPRRLIPLIALQFDARGSFVYRLDAESRAIQVPVTIGLQIDESIEIIDGIADGDQIVSAGFLGLKSGKIVRVVEADRQIEAALAPGVKQE
ncbi:MAG: RND family efflux transporter MFP subunit [Planctomycetota bacterium]